jgi:biopolymer transport protein ExbB/TolQ
MSSEVDPTPTAAPSAPEPDVAAPSAPPPRAVRAVRGTTEASVALTFLLATPLYVAILTSESSLPRDLHILLFQRGWVQHATILLTCLALAILVLKAIGLTIQRRAFALPLLDSEEATITKENVDDLVDRASLVEARTSLRGVTASLLVARVSGLLRAFSTRHDASEATAHNTKASDADADAVQSSFSLLKVLVWAIPIVGFIGTVVGIGDAVVGFSESLKHADQLDTIKGSLAKVTLGLSVAFDTTLLSLVASILVMLPLSYLQKSEERLVRDVDDRAVELLRRMPAPVETRSALAVGAEEIRSWVTAIVAPSIADMVRAHTALLTKMVEERATMTEAQAASAASQASILESQAAFAKAQAALADSHAALQRDLASLTSALRDVVPSVERAVDRLTDATALAERAQGQVAKVEDQLCREIGASRQLLQLLAAGLHDGVASQKTKQNGVNGAATQEE